MSSLSGQRLSNSCSPPRAPLFWAQSPKRDGRGTLNGCPCKRNGCGSIGKPRSSPFRKATRTVRRSLVVVDAGMKTPASGWRVDGDKQIAARDSSHSFGRYCHVRMWKMYPGSIALKPLCLGRDVLTFKIARCRLPSAQAAIQPRSARQIRIRNFHTGQAIIQ